jgi:hypothetical protein
MSVLYTSHALGNALPNFTLIRRMASCGMLRRVTLVRTDVSEELSASIIMVTSIGELGTLAVTACCSVRRLLVTASVVPSSPILVTLMILALGTSETSVLTRDTRHNIPQTPFFKVTAVKNLKSYFTLLRLI